jgi:hypothetical protein
MAPQQAAPPETSKPEGTTMKLQIEIDTANAAFEDYGPERQAVFILLKLIK